MRAAIQLFVSAVAFVWLLGVRPVRGDGVADEAEVNFRLGAERYQAADYRAALAHFLLSNRLAPNRAVRFNVARTFQRLGQFPEAHRWCQQALDGETDPTLRVQLQETLRSIEREVALIEVQSTPPGAIVYVDRRDLGSVATTPSRIALPEGPHRVILELAGHATVTSDVVQLKRGGVVPLSFNLARITGELEVSAEGATEVRVDASDGPAACITPCKLSLAPGLHTLHYRREGYRARSRQVQIAPGEATSVQVEATALTGSIVVTAQEADALVEVDDVSMGFTPVVVPNVPVGRRTVRVSLRGFEPVERSVEVSEGKQAKLRDLPLVPTRKVTTASRLSQSIEDAPASVSVLSAQELEAFRYPTVYEALRGQRGVALANDGAYAGLTVRGVGQPGDYSNRVLVLSDGATLNDNILSQAYVGYDARVDLDDVERIELVRGPGSVLYGTGAVTGVVNLIPRGVPDRPFAEARITANDARTARGRVSGGLGLGNRGGLTLSASGAHGGGESMRLATSPTATSVRGVHRFDAATMQGRLVYRDLTVQALFTVRDQDVPNGVYGAIVGDRRNSLRDTRSLIEARYEPRLGKRVQLFTRLFGNGYWFDAEQVYEGSSPESVAFVDEQYKGMWFGAEGRLLAALTDTFRFTLGAEAQLSPVASLDGAWTEQGERDVYLDEAEDYRIYAGYGLLEWQAARWMTISAGARLDAWSTFGATTNPRLALILRPTQADVIKLMAGRAFRAPSIYELRYNDGGETQLRSDFGGNKLQPELLWSSELEYSHSFADGWWALGSAHLQLAENLMEQALENPRDDTSPSYYRNGKSNAYSVGGDLEARREFRAGWMFSSTYGYLLSRYEDASAGGGEVRMPNAPRHFASVRAVAPVGGSLRLAARTTVEAPRRISAETRAQTPTAVVTDVVLTGQMARAGLDYAVGIYNLFDWRYALPTDPTFVTRTMPQPGRSLLVSLGLRL